MEEEAVFKFEVIDERVKQKAGNVVWEFQGVNSVKVIEDDQLEVKGKFDKDEMLKKLKEIDEHVEIVPVGVVKPEVNKPSRVDISNKYGFGQQMGVKTPTENAGSSNWYGLPAVFNKENMNKLVDGGMRAGAYVGGQINRENVNKLIDGGVRAGACVGEKINHVRGLIPKPQLPKLQGEANKNKHWCVRQPLPVPDKKEEKKKILNKNNDQNFKPPPVPDKKEEKNKILNKNKAKIPDKKEEKKKVLYKNNAQNKLHNGASSSIRQEEKKEKEKIQGQTQGFTQNQSGYYTGIFRTTQSTISTFLGSGTTQDPLSTQQRETTRDPTSTQAQQTKTKYFEDGKKN